MLKKASLNCFEYAVKLICFINQQKKMKEWLSLLLNKFVKLTKSLSPLPEKCYELRDTDKR